MAEENSSNFANLLLSMSFDEIALKFATKKRRSPEQSQNLELCRTWNMLQNEPLPQNRRRYRQEWASRRSKKPHYSEALMV